MNYLVVQTWNGERMDELNWARVMDFSSDKEARASLIALSNLVFDKLHMDGFIHNVIAISELDADGGRVINSGFLRWQAIDVIPYGVATQCNINRIFVADTKQEWDKLLLDYDLVYDGVELVDDGTYFWKLTKL